MTLDEIMSLEPCDPRRIKKIKRILANKKINLPGLAFGFTGKAKPTELMEFTDFLLENVAVKQDTLINALDLVGAFEEILQEAAESETQEEDTE